MMIEVTKRIPNIVVNPVVAIVDDKIMEENIISRELPEHIEDYQVESVEGLYIVVLGSVNLHGVKYHVIEVESDHTGAEDIFILSLVRAE